jgi:PAS domain-containing protein
LPYREITTRGITLLCFPLHDAVFATIATHHLASMDDPAPAALQAHLQDSYPNAVVREREPIATLRGGAAWYVYRDGRYSPFATEDASWWEAEGCAFMVVDAETGRYVEANEAAAELIGLEQASLLTLHNGDLLDVAARKTVPWVVQLFRDVGELHSTAMLRTPDGRRIAVEYHLVRDAAAHGRMVSYLRAVPHEAADASSAPDGQKDPGQ